jgi:hypothetical protein
MWLLGVLFLFSLVPAENVPVADRVSVPLLPPESALHCQWCRDWASSPLGPYDEHQFSGGGVEELNAAAAPAAFASFGFGVRGSITVSRENSSWSLAQPSFARASVRAAARSSLLSEGSWYMDCHIFNACHGNVQSGGCQNFHADCGSGANLVALLDESIRTGSAHSFRRLVELGGGRVRLLKEGRLVQIDDCIGGLLAQSEVDFSAKLSSGP